MTEITNNPQAIFPDMPRDRPAVDKEGNLSPLWDLGLSALFQALQENYRNEGIRLPPLTASSMSIIQNLYTQYIGKTYNTLTLAQPDISGQTVYDKDTQITNQFVIAQDNSNDVTLAEWVPFAMMLTYEGNPNGNVAGVLNWLCLNTTAAMQALYCCTTAGNAADAVWTAL
jgi:hypothetical protein